MADLGVEGVVQPGSYIASWLKALKGDKRYIFKAASAYSGENEHSFWSVNTDSGSENTVN